MDDKWSLGTCKQEVGSRSYLVECRGKIIILPQSPTPRTISDKKSTNTHWEPDTEAEDTSSEGEDIENPIDL